MTYRPYLFVGAIAVSLAGAAIAQQQPDWDAIQVTATEVRPGVAVLFGNGGNIGVSHGADGTLIVDDQFAPLVPKIQAAVAGLGGGGQQPDFGDLGDIFETIFGSAFGGGQSRNRPRRGADLRYDMEVTLEDAFHGKSTEIKVEVSVACEPCAGSGAAPGTSRRTCELCRGNGKVRAHQGLFVIERPCPTCHGTGQVIENPCRECRGEGRVDKVRSLEVEIPVGVDNGTRIRLNGKGEAGPNGAPPGDLYIFCHVKPHPVFQREGNALFTRVPVSFTIAALGGTIEIPGLDGEKHEIEIPAGIQSGRQLRKRGAGMPVLQARGRGDLVTEIMVETPTRLSARQKELLREFRETETGEECPESAGFFAKLKSAFKG